jgi:hypothetical protein
VQTHALELSTSLRALSPPRMTLHFMLGDFIGDGNGTLLPGLHHGTSTRTSEVGVPDPTFAAYEAADNISQAVNSSWAEVIATYCY